VEIPPAGPRTEAQQEQSGKQQNPMQQNLRITWLIIGNLESVTKTRHVADAKFAPPAVKWLRVSHVTCHLSLVTNGNCRIRQSSLTPQDFGF
jgi:hypothetical protein